MVLANAYSPIFVTELGIYTLVGDEQFWNVFSPMVLNDPGSMMDSRLEQPLKVPFKETRLAGILTVVRLLHPVNVVANSVILSDKTTLVSEMQL